MTAKISDCLIIGGGISGLIAGNILQTQGIKVKILDKGRGIGGRLATRRFSHPGYGEGIFDYGCPYFTVTSPVFKLTVEKWLKAGIVKPWIKTPENIYYCGVISNRAIAKYLAADLDVSTSTRVIKIQWQEQENHWQVFTETEEIYQAKTLILTPPLPQTLQLLADSPEIIISNTIKNKLVEITYDPCIAVLALLSAAIDIPSPGSLSIDSDNLSWISCNQQKGISPEAVAVTLLATATYSRSHWEDSDESIIQDLMTSASPWIKSEIISYQVHRWRYSQPQKVYGEPFLALTTPGNLILAGDGFVPSGVEGAALSGIAAADYAAANIFLKL